MFKDRTGNLAGSQQAVSCSTPHDSLEPQQGWPESDRPKCLPAIAKSDPFCDRLPVKGPIVRKLFVAMLEGETECIHKGKARRQGEDSLENLCISEADWIA